MESSSNIDKCVALFGFDKVAWLTGSESDAVFKWTVAAEVPSEVQLATLNMTVMAFQLVKRGANGRTAQQWLIDGKSPVDGYTSPLDAIRAGEGSKVINHINQVMNNLRKKHGTLLF